MAEYNIAVNEYKSIIERDVAARCIINALTAAAELNYDKTGLRFDSDVIETAFRVIMPETYAKTLAKLQEADK